MHAANFWDLEAMDDTLRDQLRVVCPLVCDYSANHCSRHSITGVAAEHPQAQDAGISVSTGQRKRSSMAASSSSCGHRKRRRVRVPVPGAITAKRRALTRRRRIPWSRVPTQRHCWQPLRTECAGR